MAGEEDEIVVAVEPEVPVQQEPVVVEAEPVKKADPEPAPSPSDELAEQFKVLQAERDRDRQARDAADRVAREARQENERLRREAVAARTAITDSQYDTVASGLDAAQAEARAAEQEYKTAFEAGDPAAMAKAQRNIARAEAKIVRLDEAKATLEDRRKAEPEDEAYISGRTEPTAKWLRAHSDFITDPRKNAKLTGAHYDAIGEGIGVDTPEYFAHVEKFLGLDQPAVNGKANGQPKPAPKRPAVAPVQASSGGTNGGGTQIRLTAAEARSATDGTLVYNSPDPTGKNRWKVGDPIGIQEMARRKHEMQKQGLYDKSYTEQ